MSFRDLGNAVGSTLYRGIGRASSHLHEQRSLPVDVLENEGSYLVVFDAPGAERDDVQVRYVNGTVKIRVDRFREFHDGFEMRFPGRGMTLDGEATLPDDATVDPDAGMARLTEYGTLNVEIPKERSSEADAESIEIDD